MKYIYTALLWQKEASDIPSKAELLMFSYCSQCALLPGWILCINTHPAKRYVRQDIVIFHWRQWKWQTDYALLQQISLLSLASFCQIRAVYFVGLEPEGHWNWSMIFFFFFFLFIFFYIYFYWKAEGHYHRRLYTAIAPFLFLTEHC